MSNYELILGDALEVLATLPAGSVDAVVTDPPYGMDWDTNTTRFSGGDAESMAKRGAGRNCASPVLGDDKPFDPALWLDFPIVVLFGMNHFAARLPVGTTLVWIKRMDAGFGSFLSDAELAWMKGGYGVYCKRDTSLMGETRNRLHPTQKPLSLMKWVLNMAKVPIGSTVLDPFAGSFTTGVACIQTGRNFIGIEKDPGYFAIGKQRMEEARMQMPLFQVAIEDAAAQPLLLAI